MIIIETCPECSHDLLDVVIATYPPIPKKICSNPNCDWRWIGQQEKIVRIPFDENSRSIESLNQSTEESRP